MRLSISIFALAVTGLAWSQNYWVQRDSMNGPPKASGAVFTLNDDAYFVTGLDEFSFKRSMYSYDISQDDWDNELSLGGETGDGLNRGSAIAFSMGGFGYCGLGTGSVEYFKDLWRFDAETNVWTQMADFEGTARREAVAFVIDHSAYVGTGQDASGLTQDFWKYDAVSNDWTPIADFPGTARRDAVGFAMVGQGYVGTGVDASTYLADFWAYYPLTNSWVQKADFPGTPRHGAVGFGVFPNAYIGLGEDNTFTYKKDLWEFNYFGNTWTQRTNFPASGRAQAIAIVVQGRAFVGTGYDGSFHDDFYEYIPLLGTEELDNQGEALLYPNPANNYCFIEWPGDIPLEKVTICDLSGKDCTSEFVVSFIQPGKLYIENNASKGEYLIQITSDKFLLSKKLIIQ